MAEVEAAPASPVAINGVSNGEGSPKPPAPGGEASAQAPQQNNRPPRPEEPSMTVEEANAGLKALVKVNKPDDKEHNEKVAAINEEVKRLKDRVEEIRGQIDEASNARSADRDVLTEHRNLLRDLRNERDVLKGELDTIQAQRTAAKTLVDQHTQSKRAMQREVKFTTAGEIEAEIQKLERKQQTQSMSLSAEKQLLKDIETLKQQRKIVAKFGSQEEEIKGALDKHGEVRRTETEKRTEWRAVQDKIKAQQAVMEELTKGKEGENSAISTLIEQRNQLRNEISAKIQEVKDLRNEFKEKNDEFWNFTRELRRLTNAKKKAEWEARQAVYAERQRAIQEEEMKKIPYEEEMALCDALVLYLQTNFPEDKEEDAPATEETKKAASSTAEAAEFGGKQLVMRKRQDEDFIVMGGKGKKQNNKKKPASQKAKKQESITHQFDILERFSILSLEAPSSRSAVPKTVEAVKAKKEWYSKQERGSVPSASKDKKDRQGGEGTKRSKEKAPEINEEMFPSLPGKPKQAAVPKDVEVEGEGGDLESTEIGEEAEDSSAAQANGAVSEEASAPTAQENGPSSPIKAPERSAADIVKEGMKPAAAAPTPAAESEEVDSKAAENGAAEAPAEEQEE